MVIYRLTNRLTGEAYVGQTASLVKRLAALRSRARCERRHRTPIYDAIARYGFDGFAVDVLETCSSRAELNVAERRWINDLNTYVPLGYNLKEGGYDGRLAESTKAKLRGRKRSAETRARLRALKRTAEHRLHLSEAMRGKKPNENQKRGLAISRTIKHDRSGERNARAIVTQEQVIEIRQLYAAGGYSQEALGKKFGIRQVTVSAMIRGRTWR